jgi:hypothetical protein
MASKRAAKLAEAGKGCSPRRVGGLAPRIKNHFIPKAYCLAPRGTQLASLLASDLLGSRR